MKTDISPATLPPTSPVEILAGRLSDRLLDEIDTGTHPVMVAEAAFLAALPLLLEATRAPTIEACLASLAARFDGNQLRREH